MGRSLPSSECTHYKESFYVSIPQFLIQKYRLIYLDKIEYLVIKGAGRKGQSTTTAPESSPARLY